MPTVLYQLRCQPVGKTRKVLAGKGVRQECWLRKAAGKVFQLFAWEQLKHSRAWNGLVFSRVLLVSCGLRLIYPVGAWGQTLKIAPPLTIPREALEEGLAVLAQATDEAALEFKL